MGGVGYYSVKLIAHILTALLISFFTIFTINSTLAQCDTPDPSEDLFNYYISMLPKQENYRMNRNSSEIQNIPIYFTVIRNTDGSSINNIDNAKIDLTLNILTQKYISVWLSFSRLGDVNYIDWTALYNGQYITRYKYSYISTAINVIVHDNGNSSSSQPEVEKNLDFYSLEDNTILGNSIGLDGNYPAQTADFIHEVGHIFGLLHTHGATTAYQNPVFPNQQDHPYDGTPKLKRELQIRVKTNGKTFEEPNWDQAGDICGDTYPAVTDVQVFYPGGSLWCPYNGTYSDYNNDSVTPDIHNYMGYFYCERNEITNCQYDKIAMIYDDYRSKQFLDIFQINYNSHVNYENTTEPIKNVVFEWEFKNDLKKWRGTSGVDGKLEGILYKPDLKVATYKLGSIIEPLQVGTDVYYYLSGFSPDEWKERLSAYDLYTLKNHLLQVKLLKNGYKRLAADLDKNHQIQGADAKLLSNLLVGKVKKLNAYKSPYVFVPEFIPQNYTASFNTNPFSMTINGQQVTNAQYIDPSYEFTISNGMGNGAGFDGVKIGNVSDERLTIGNEEPGSINPNLINPLIQLQSGQLYKLDFKFDTALSGSAFQFNFVFDTSKVSIINYYHPTGSPLGDSLNSYIDGNQLSTVWYNSNGDSTNISINQLFESVLILPKQNTYTTQIIHIDTTYNSSAIFNASGDQIAGDVKIFTSPFYPSQKISFDKPFDDGLLVYPNPSSGEVNLKFELADQEDIDIRIFDVNGKLKFSSNLNLTKGNQDFKINKVREFGSGAYYFVLKTQEQIYNQVFIKQ